MSTVHSDGSPEPELLVETRGRLGVLTLNRPRAINALTHAMVITIGDALESWRDDPDVATVVIVGAGDRGLCAGGDVVSLHRAATQGEPGIAAEFWRDEYRMNATIANYPKPVVAIQDGIVLGGGIGVSAHALHRIVTERSRLGFPEVTIGFVPDVGGTWLLSRAPGAAGVRLGLTAEHVGAADAIYVRFSDHFVPSTRIAALLAALESAEPAVVIPNFAEDPGRSELAANAAAIDDAFDRADLGEVLARLGELGEHDMAAAISEKSPISLAVTLEAIRRSRSRSTLEDALAQEFRVSMNALVAPDFAEGVRAQLIDKDRKPEWNPSTIAEVPVALVESYFSATAEPDLTFGAAGPVREERP